MDRAGVAAFWDELDRVSRAWNEWAGCTGQMVMPSNAYQQYQAWRLLGEGEEGMMEDWRQELYERSTPRIRARMDQLDALAALLPKLEKGIMRVYYGEDGWEWEAEKEELRISWQEAHGYEAETVGVELAPQRLRNDALDLEAVAIKLREMARLIEGGSPR